MHSNSPRPDGREFDELRPCRIWPHWTKNPEGSVLIECGGTRVLCTASWEDQVPPWRAGRDLGWVTAEYSMLPRATGTRSPREAVSGRNSRSQEISRLIGRSLRMAVDFEAMGECAVYIDCDVLQADGGTRTASVTGGWLALREAADWALEKGLVRKDFIRHQISAVSVGVTDAGEVLDLDYAEDSRAFTDMNVVQTEDGGFVEIQGTGERAPFSPSQLSFLLDLASKGNEELRQKQREAEK
ncbi:MAG: ribonuclease PH [Aeriscardovia sp.]|nr:ribonuclease PH [Aeriscardovia sp.]